MKKYLFYARSMILNFVYFHTLSKRIVFGKNVKIDGRVFLGKKIVLDDNVELRNHTKEKLIVGSNTSINRNTVVRGKVNIGDNVSIAPNCMIVGANHKFDNLSLNIKDQGYENKGIHIENNVWVGANCCILDGTVIGTGSVIGAGSIVTKSIPPMSIAVGNPCKVIKRRF